MQKIKCFDYCGDKNAFIPLLGFALSDISETLDEEEKVDNEEDCGHVIRAGDYGRHRDNDDVRDNLHQDSENAGGDYMADTASLKEILFRHSAKQCKVCEAIPFDQIGHQIEYEKFKMLHEVIEGADLEDEYQEWRRAYGYV